MKRNRTIQMRLLRALHYARKKDFVQTPAVVDPSKMQWICANCGPLNVNDFGPNNRSLCKQCVAAETARRYRENKEMMERRNR